MDKPNLFIAATASENELRVDTLNTQHFSPIDRLQLLKK